MLLWRCPLLNAVSLYGDSTEVFVSSIDGKKRLGKSGEIVPPTAATIRR
ncbi:hypothetical protein TcasGA2_TC034353 [Tribolium castaneum]|uniref:Uncharacterized protein n=1 Tax=Tribolium castaneum TaxID=7070 RepID=A0A139WB66_TRICA|nr:hypothetical protein TcasGA2_TC034353 [Tribolium castaneum]